MFSSPVIANGIIYLGSSDGYLYTLNATKGTLLGRFAVKSPLATTPAVVNGTVYIGSANGYFYAINGQHQNWRYQVSGATFSTAIVANNTVYIGSRNGYLYALNATKGTLTWKFQTKAQIVSQASAANRTVYFGSSDHNLYAVDATTGLLTSNHMLSILPSHYKGECIMRRTPLFFLTTACITVAVLTLLLTSFFHVQTSRAARPTYLTIGNTGTPHDALTRHTLTNLSVATTGSNPLSYYGGPVMQSSITYAIFWEPPTLQDGTATSVSPTYNSLIEQYFNDVGGSGLYNNNIQYYDTTGHILNNSTLGGVWVDTSSYPPSTCTDSYTPHGCISDDQIKAEVLNAMNVNGWSGGVNHAFFVFTAWGEGSCHGDCAFSNFCAFHNYFTSNGQPIVYANMPYMGTDLANCGTNTSPNNDPDADSTINYLSHEHMEMVTDPLLNAWHDANNGEIGDKCGAKFGTLSYDNGAANEEWNGHYYIVQEEFSDALNGCVQTRAMSGTLYVGSDDNNLYALHAPDGSSLWNQSTGNKVVSSPTVVNGVVYVGSLDHSIYAFRTSDHSLLWKYPTKGPLHSSPTVVKGILYIGSSDNNLYAINATTGKLLWHFATGGAITSSPTVASGIVYVGSSDHNLYALNATKGTRKWRFPTGGTITSSPSVLKGAVYVGSQDDYLYSINASTGLLNWKATTNGPITQSSPAATDTTIYIGSSNGSVYAFSTTNGSQLWSYSTGGAVSSSPKVFADVVYIGSTNNVLYALKATNGSFIWSYATGGQIVSSPTVIDGMVYAGSNDGNVYALWFNDATLLWSYSTSRAVESSPAVVLGSY